MKISDYRDGMIVKVKACDYGTFKTHKLVPKIKKGQAQLVEVLHSSTFGEVNWNFAVKRTFRLVDLVKV